MFDSKTQLLFNQLVRKTDSGDLKWELTETKDAFQTIFKEGVIRVALVVLTNQMGQKVNEYRVLIFDKNGNMVDYINAQKLNPIYPAASLEDLKSLHQKARGIATGSSQIINSILDELNSKSP